MSRGSCWSLPETTRPRRNPCAWGIFPAEKSDSQTIAPERECDEPREFHRHVATHQRIAPEANGEPVNRQAGAGGQRDPPRRGRVQPIGVGLDELAEVRAGEPSGGL